MVMPTAVMMLSIGKDDVDEHDLDKGGGDAERRGMRLAFVRLVRLDPLVDLGGRLPHQKEAARQQQQVAQRKRMPEHGRERLGQMNDRRGRGQQREAQDKRGREADAARQRAGASARPGSTGAR